ncbi:protein kinase domain-containing protein [Novipirellula artificiosorum]|uniref:Serine/threonine-protein kinase PknJ n=1 Tax=Novipirellula artificiosorum TaxID=2528016 RepID=A0A5C6DGP0_9BACT|nr:protein kinase [Novipirellula artificiosorum]TWU34891.1 Serine/threonine-protein kinase PknJ [Novipirellula artificiosorum]
MDLEQREYRADALLMRRLRVDAGMTVADFRVKAMVDRSTANKMLRGEPVLLSKLKQAVSRAFGIDSVLEVLHPEEKAAMGAQTSVAPSGSVLEYEVEKYLSGWATTTNGLQYQLVKLRHRFIPQRFARGKCYELRHMSDRERTEVEVYLHRHIEVCDRIDDHPNVARNITAAEVDGLWWVIDRWEDGETVAQRMKAGAFSDYELKVVMTGIAEGLIAMHAEGIIRRELTPASVLLRAKNDQPVLTDLEMAKINKGGPTVAPAVWPDDPYRALEVTGSKEITEKADIYSWGRIFAHAAWGNLPERGKEEIERLTKLPTKTRDVVNLSLQITPSARKVTLKQIVDSLKAWIV